ncbi:MAG: nucleoside triphosphate pyrophosphohydrolase [Nitrospiria bacterium]
MNKKKVEIMTEKVKPDVENKFAHLIAIMAQLRSENGCPWDKQQTHKTLRPYLLEETFEVLEALDLDNSHALKEELGDLLLQIVFHSQIASENNRFEISDVIDNLVDKLIRRHPNVFGDEKINSAREQSINWEKLKKKEGKKSVLDGVPKALSGLLRAWRIQQKAATQGFDWPHEEPVWAKIHEEIDELKHALEGKSEPEIEEEFGDVLFSLVNISRFIKVNPEDALRKTIEKFIRRFKHLEQEFADKEAQMSEASLEELDSIWEKMKAKESGK